MGRVVVTCPSTRQTVPTGVSMDRKSFEALGTAQYPFKCLVCRQKHKWDKKRAWLKGE